MGDGVAVELPPQLEAAGAGGLMGDGVAVELPPQLEAAPKPFTVGNLYGRPDVLASTIGPMYDVAATTSSNHFLLARMLFGLI